MLFIKRFSLSSMFVVLLSSQVYAGLDINEGTVNTGSLVTNTLYIGPNSQLNLNSNASWAYITVTPFDQIWDYTSSGFNGGSWDGPGIISGWAKDHPLEDGRLAVISGNDYMNTLGLFDFHGYEVQ